MNKDIIQLPDALKALNLPMINLVNVSYAFFLMADLASKKLSDFHYVEQHNH